MKSVLLLGVIGDWCWWDCSSKRGCGVGSAHCSRTFVSSDKGILFRVYHIAVGPRSQEHWFLQLGFQKGNGLFCGCIDFSNSSWRGEVGCVTIST